MQQQLTLEPQQQIPQITLESVAEQLQSWRLNKPSVNSRIPKNIRDNIKHIGKNCTYKQLSRALKIYGSSLTNIISNKKRKKKTIEFIELTQKSIPEPTKSELSLKQINISCSLKHPNGTTMTIQQLSDLQLISVVKGFICSI